MFNKEKKQTSSRTSGETPGVNMISAGTVVKGAISTKSDIRISGKVDGTLESDGKVIVSKGGVISGDLRGKEADIAGTVEGEIHVLTKLTLRATSNVKGDITTRSLLVEDGATFDGACNMSHASNEKSVKSVELNTNGRLLKKASPSLRNG